MKRLIGLVIVGILALPVYGQIYKWTDDRGTVQYTEVPPPNRPFEMLNKAPPPSRDPQEVLKELRDKVQAVDQTNQAAQQRTATQANQDQQAQRAENCKRAQENIKLLEGTQPVFLRQNPSDPPIELTPEARQEQLLRSRKDAEYFCN